MLEDLSGRWKTLGLILLILIFLGVFFYPKKSGGPLCGPVCPEEGLRHWDKECLGFEKTYSCSGCFDNMLGEFPGVDDRTCTEGNTDCCFGLTVSDKKCYGVPPSGETTSENIRMDCNT